MDAETARPRARAAWAFSGLDQGPLAEKSGIHKDRLRAILGNSGRVKEVTLDELHDIADACGVPRTFMERGFDDDDLAVRVDELEAAVRKLAREAVKRDETLARLRRSLPPASGEASPPAQDDRGSDG